MPQFKKLGGMLYNGEFGAGDDNRLNIDKHFASLSHILKEKYLKWFIIPPNEWTQFASLV